MRPWLIGLLAVLALLVMVVGSSVLLGGYFYSMPASATAAPSAVEVRGTRLSSGGLGDQDLGAVLSDAETLELSQPAQVSLPTATPRAQVVIAPPTEGVDYETAVFMNIYEQVNPSVVHLSIYQLGSTIIQQGLVGVDQDALYPVSSGSGFVWDISGNLVTNNHVVDGADRIVIRFADGTQSIGEVVGTDVDSDLAVVRMDPTGYDLRPIVLGDLDEVKVGQRVAAIGNPFGLEGTLTTGIVSAIGRSIPARASFTIPASIQTDAPINPGNSGGPLLNERGELIGVNAQIRSEERANSGVGFAIPVSIVERVVPALIANGEYIHPYMGISGLTYSPICAEEQGLPASLRGAVVASVLAGTPAQQAGIRAGRIAVETEYFDICPDARGGDVIIGVNGEGVTSFDDILSYLQLNTSPGDTITLTVLRDGASVDVPLTLGERPRRQ